MLNASSGWPLFMSEVLFSAHFKSSPPGDAESSLYKLLISG